MTQTTVESRAEGPADPGDGAVPHRPAAAPSPRGGPGPRWVVARECVRAALDGLLLPFRALGYTFGRERARAELLGLLERPAEVQDPPEALLRVPTDRPLRIFLSCAEPSGELHASSVLARLRDELAARGAPPPRVVGLGGPRLADEGVLVDDPELATYLDGVVVRLFPEFEGSLRVHALSTADMNTYSTASGRIYVHAELLSRLPAPNGIYDEVLN